MKKLLFLIHTLGGGGAEKALVNLVNNLDSSKYDITVETLFDDGINAKNLKPHIHYISKRAFCPKGVSVLYKLFPERLLYRYFVGKSQYDLVIAYMHGIPVKVIAGARNVKKIAWLHNGNPESSTMLKSWIFHNNAIKAYRSCDAIVGVCHSVSDAFAEYTQIKDKMCVVYNTLETDKILTQAKQSVSIEFDSRCINIVSTGRLGKEKGYTRLIDVCKRLIDENYRIRLYLIGTGSEESALKRRTAELGLDKEVVFLGYQENPYQYVDKCDLFVCSSYTEGLSTATIEALILGKAIVSTDVSGAREILGNSVYGLVVESSDEGLYCGIKKLLDNSELMKQYSKKAKKRSTLFSTDSTVMMAEELFERYL